VRLGDCFFPPESKDGRGGFDVAFVPLSAQGQYFGTVGRHANACRGALPRLLLRGLHDIYRTDVGDGGDVIFVWARGVFPVRRAVATIASGAIKGFGLISGDWPVAWLTRAGKIGGGELLFI
jgi:hypothetical protein